MNRAMRSVAGIAAVALLAAAGLLLIRQSVYGWTIFVVLPGFLGAAAVFAAQPASGGKAASIGATSVFLGLFAFFALGLEGVNCIVMTMPLAVPLGALGGWLAYRLERRPAGLRSLAALLILPPAALQHDTQSAHPLHEVRSSLEIAAPPGTVWRHVVEFSELPPPSEWLFRTGIAYPKRARIEGRGPGAVRYCEFSTGPFVEPIDVWDESRRLAFRVTSTPPTMQEWSPYKNVVPPHVEGTFVSERGEFRLRPLPGGRTLLEGATWYRHGLFPAFYWRMWSDAIIHAIHMRVLEHVRKLAEAERNSAAPANAERSAGVERADERE